MVTGYRILAAEPTTLAEAEALASELAAVTAASPSPGAPQVLAYNVMDTSVLAFLPNLPCAGPPTPGSMGIRWPYVVRDQIYTLKGQKPRREQEIEILPNELPSCVVHVLSRRLDGQFVQSWRNLAVDIDLPGGIFTWALETLVENVVNKLIDVVADIAEALPRGESRNKLTPFQVTGNWPFIKALWEILTRKRITVRLDASVTIPGYETPQFIVEALNKRFVGKVEIPIQFIRWSAI